MSRTASNLLKIRSLEGGIYELHGYVKVDGNLQRIRKRSTSLAELSKFKQDEETKALSAIPNAAAMALRYTTLTDDQLREAEMAFRRAKDRSLLDCVIDSEKVGGKAMPKDALEALHDWLNNQENVRELYQKTRTNNLYRGKRFLAACGAKIPKTVKKPIGCPRPAAAPLVKCGLNVSDITPAMVEAFVMRQGITGTTKLGEGRVVKAYFNYCKTKGWLNESPFKVDMKEVKKRAMAKHQAAILTPEQAQGMLTAASEERRGEMVPWCILSIWGFLREQEIHGNEVVGGLTPDCVSEGPDGTLRVRVQSHKSGTARNRTTIIPANVAPLLRECIAKGIWKKGKKPVWTLASFNNIREAAGLIERGDRKTPTSQRSITANLWQANIGRHTGVSYLFNSGAGIAVCTERAGHSAETAFKHYLSLGSPETAAKFYACTAKLPGETILEEAAAA